jgi:malate/lactate dehydrogenase
MRNETAWVAVDGLIVVATAPATSMTTKTMNEARLAPRRHVGPEGR